MTKASADSTAPYPLTDEQRNGVIGLVTDAMVTGGLDRSVAKLVVTELLDALVAQAQSKGLPYDAAGDTDDATVQHILIDAMLKANPEAAAEFGVTFPEPA